MQSHHRLIFCNRFARSLFSRAEVASRAAQELNTSGIQGVLSAVTLCAAPLPVTLSKKLQGEIFDAFGDDDITPFTNAHLLHCP